MMMTFDARWFAAALAVLGAGCGSNGFAAGNPLQGAWLASINDVTFTGTATVTLGADGSVTEALTAMKIALVPCSGTETTTGLTWSSTGTTITVGGQSTCMGAFTCGPASVACSSAMSLQAGTCTYALTNNNDTLTLTSCTDPRFDLTFTRSM
jgi:hypothetical protein